MILNKTILSICLCALAGSAFSSVEFPKSRLYVGTHAQLRYTGFDKKFGSAIMRKVHNQGNIFAGFKFSDNFAIEIGREVMVGKLKSTTLVEGQTFNGVPIPKELSPSIFMTNMNLKCNNLDMVFYKKIFDEIPLSFVPSIGISHITIDITRDNLYCGNFNNKIPSRIFNKSFFAFKPSAALQYDFENGFSLRTSATFINTYGTKMEAKDSQTLKLRNKPRVHLKDSFVFGLGFVCNL